MLLITYERRVSFFHPGMTLSLENCPLLSSALTQQKPYGQQPSLNISKECWKNNLVSTLGEYFSNAEATTQQ